MFQSFKLQFQWNNFLGGFSEEKRKRCLIFHFQMIYFFSYQGFLYRHWRFTGQQGKRGGHLWFHSTTSTRSRTLRHLFATLHVRWLSLFLIATFVFTRLLLDEIYHLIELPFEWLIDDAMFVYLLDELILRFCYSNLTLETGGFELASTITLALQANQLSKCDSHPKWYFMSNIQYFDLIFHVRIENWIYLVSS